MYKIITDAATDIGVGEFIVKDTVTGEKILNPTINRLMRTGTLQTFMPLAVAGVFGIDLGGLPGLFGGSKTSLIENPVAADMVAIGEYMTADPDESEEELEKKYDATYGKPLALHLFGGPFLGDMHALNVASGLDFMDLVPDEYEKLKNMAYDPDNEDWNYQMARIFSIAGARWGWHLIPAITNQKWEAAERILLGAYKPKYLKDWFGMEEPLIGKMRNVYANVPFLPEIKDTNKRKRGKQKSQRELKAKALATLTSLRLNRSV